MNRLLLLFAAVLQQVLAVRTANRLVSYDTYRSLLFEPDRHYHIVAYFRATDQVCRSCAVVDSQFWGAAAAYTNASLSASEDPAVVFVSIDVQRQGDSAAMHKITHVPIVTHFGKDVDLPGVYAASGGFLEIAEEQRAPLHEFLEKDSSDSRLMIQWVQHKTGVLPLHDPKEQISSIGVGIMLFFLGLLMVGVVAYCTVARKYPTIITVTVLVAAWLSISGLTHSVQHKAPFFGQDRQGNIQFFANGRRQQYFGEGLMMGGFEVGIGLLLLLISYLPKTSFGQNTIMANIVLSVLIVTFLAAYHAVGQAHRIKMPIGKVPFFPPQEYRSGPLWNDRGNSF